MQAGQHQPPLSLCLCSLVHHTSSQERPGLLQPHRAQPGAALCTPAAPDCSLNCLLPPPSQDEVGWPSFSSRLILEVGLWGPSSSLCKGSAATLWAALLPLPLSAGSLPWARSASSPSHARLRVPDGLQPPALPNHGRLAGKLWSPAVQCPAFEPHRPRPLPLITF